MVIIITMTSSEEVSAFSLVKGGIDLLFWPAGLSAQSDPRIPDMVVPVNAGSLCARDAVGADRAKLVLAPPASGEKGVAALLTFLPRNTVTHVFL